MRATPAQIDQFQNEILTYWTAHGRHSLPWRKTTDPWKILLAEVTLRKTGSQQAVEIYPELIRYSPERLATAQLAEIERLLLPIGIYTIRAKSLIAIGQRVAQEGKEQLQSEEFLLSLPGVGQYITNAVRCSAFGFPVPALDTNMIRVVQRVFGLSPRRKRPRDDGDMWDFAGELVSTRQPKQYNWGVIDFGAQICTARSPKCDVCPLQSNCLFYQSTRRPIASNPTGLELGLAARQPLAQPKVVSLFSGAGGFDWGFHRAGYETLLACELLPGAAQTLGHNLNLRLTTPDAGYDSVDRRVIQGDIEGIDFSKIALSPDVLIGGPPCQDFSVSKAQERQGLGGQRGHLYQEFVRAIMYLQPKMFVFENVPGLTSANRGKAIRTIVGDLRNLEQTRQTGLGADASYTVPITRVEDYIILYKDIVDAVRLGVPQIRRRLIIIGMRKDLFDALPASSRYAAINRIDQHLGGHSFLFPRYPLTSIEAFEGKPLPALQAEYREIMAQYRELAETAMTDKAYEWKRTVWDNLQFDIVEDYMRANQMNGGVEFSHSEFERAMREHEGLLKHMGWFGRRVDTLQFEDGTNLPGKQSDDVVARMNHIPPDQNADFVVGTEWEVESKQISFIYRRTSPLKPAFTVMAYGGGGTHGYHYRRERSGLTLRERARIQTFTDDFLFKGQHIRAQIGEAVPPLLGERIAEVLKELLSAIG